MLVKTLTTLAAAALTVAQCTATPRFSGSFIQPWLLSSWAASGTIDASLGYLQEACITTSVLQWTLDTAAKTVAYPTNLQGYTRMASADLVEGLLTAADKRGIKVFLGLQLGSDWFDNSANNPAWLNAQAALAKTMASELQTKYGSHASLAGWYLPFEMDNLNFPDATTQDRMGSFYADVIAHIKTLGAKPVAIAPFFNPSLAMGPAGWQAMWTRILAAAPIDIIALQDGCGAGNVPTTTLPAWFAATRAAIKAARPSTKLYADTETFTGDSITGGFRTQGWTRILADMRAVKPYVDDFWAFSYDHYQIPSVASAAYHAAYRRYLSGGAADTVKPSTPAAPTKAGMGLKWAASTDNLAVAGYQVYRNNVLVGYAPTTVWTDATAVAGTIYSYALKAFDAYGNVSPLGSAATILM